MPPRACVHFHAARPIPRAMVSKPRSASTLRGTSRRSSSNEHAPLNELRAIVPASDHRHGRTFPKTASSPERRRRPMRPRNAALLHAPTNGPLEVRRSPPGVSRLSRSADEHCVFPKNVPERSTFPLLLGRTLGPPTVLRSPVKKWKFPRPRPFPARSSPDGAAHHLHGAGLALI